jgi:hypothetical protein
MTEPAKSLIDVHVHLAALPDGGNGCIISKRFLKSPILKFIAWRMGVDINNPPQANRAYLDRLLKDVRGSQRIAKAVVLGLDGVYDAAGRLDEKETEFLISNDFILKACRDHADVLLPGVSINPTRRDAVNEVARCAQAGAALVKVLPNTQRFDPAAESCVPFYKALAQHKLPLLSHVGFEFTLLGQDQSVGDPAKLRRALDEGVTVISAHGASYGLWVYEKYWETLVDFCRRYPNYYWDASALSLPNRVGMLLKIRRHPEVAARMLFGTDYPLPSYALPALLARPGAYPALHRLKNPFDRHAALLEALGLPLETARLNTNAVLKLK